LNGSALGDLKTALTDLNLAIKLKPDFADAYYNRGKTLGAMGDAKGAIADYTKAIELNPKLAEAYGSRGVLRAQTGDKPAGLADLQRAAQIFTKQGNQAGYQQTQIFIRQVEQISKPQ
jgi:tetratricopeptide (TPR) repeat protein